VAVGAVTVLEELRSLVLARKLLDREIAEATEQALVIGEPRTSVAYVLGISRASLYRQFGNLVGGESKA